MSVKNFLTNEKLGERFDNSFALVNYAISFAKNRLTKGELHNTNLACDVLNEIVDNRDLLDLESESDETLYEDEVLEEIESA